MNKMSKKPEEMPDNETDQPLVTFALFAYNQEKYIREAVEGAFAQTYEPLEIILSDDCSTDRTFEIMQDMAAGYEGPHSVRARRNETNVGVIDHFLTVAHSANGRLFIAAAGDDISYYNRAEEITAKWKRSGAIALYSACDVCTDDGEIVAKVILPDPLDRIQELFNNCVLARRFDGKVRHIPGYSAAYDTKFLKDFPLSGEGAHNEDALLTYAVNLKGGLIDVVPGCLMCRRISDTSISSKSIFKDKSEVKKNEFVIRDFSRSTLKFFKYFLRLEDKFERHDYSIIKRSLRKMMPYYYTVSIFWELSLPQRFKRLFTCRSSMETKFIFPRLLGINAFCAIKKFIG